DIEHIDLIGALERGESNRRILQGRNQRQLTGKAFAERVFVVDGSGPGFLLRFAVIVTGQFQDGRSKDRRQYRRIRREERPQRRFGQRLSHYRAISQVVPSLESLITTPIAASSSRMRSDSLKSFRARAAVRSEIKRSTRLTSMPLACCLRCFHSSAVCERNPSSRKEAANSLRPGSLSDAAFLKPCSEVIICAVLRSSDNASITA